MKVQCLGGIVLEFKTAAFGGFDKQSVLTYIDELISKSQEREAELQRQADEASSSRDLMSSQLAELQVKVTSLEEQLSKKDEAVNEREEALQKREEQLSASQAGKDARIAELESQLAQACERVNQLQGALHQGEEKSRRYDEVTAQVGAVMLEAQKQADDIVSRARSQAEQIAKDSIDNIYDINKRVDEFKNDIYRLRSFAAETLQGLDDKMSAIDLAIKEAEGHLYISAGNTDSGEPAYEEPYQAPSQQAPAGAGYEPRRMENPDFFTQPYQG